MRLMVPLCTLFLLCLGAPVSRAQMMPFNNGFDGTLNGDDMKALMAAGEQLYGQNQVADGASDTWSNASSGNGGTITVPQSLTQNGMQCRKVRYDIRLANPPTTRDYTVN